MSSLQGLCVHSVYPKAILDVQYKANPGRVQMKGPVSTGSSSTDHSKTMWIPTYLPTWANFFLIFFWGHHTLFW
jgi:hypothetical protein